MGMVDPPIPEILQECECRLKHVSQSADGNY